VVRRRTSDALTVDRVQVGRLFALAQGSIWLATLSGTAFRTGWVLGLLAFAAAVSARSHPGRSVALLVGPAAIIAGVVLLSLSRSQLDVRLGTATSLASEVVPGLLAGVLIWAGRAKPAQGVARASVRFEAPPIGRPLSIALGLAAIAALPVALSFNVAPPNHAIANEGFVSAPIDWRPLDLVPGLALAAVASLLGAVVGSVIGTYAWSRRPIVAGPAALAGAWAAGVISLPLVAAGLGIHLRTGIVCVMGCEAWLRDDQPLGGFAGYAMFVLGSAIVVWPVVLGAGIVIAVATILSSRGVRGSSTPRRSLGRPRLLLLLAAFAGFAVIHGAGIGLMASSGQTGFIPYVSLSLGTAIWLVLLHRAWKQPEPPGEAASLPG